MLVGATCYLWTDPKETFDYRFTFTIQTWDWCWSFIKPSARKQISISAKMSKKQKKHTWSVNQTSAIQACVVVYALCESVKWLCFPSSDSVVTLVALSSQTSGEYSLFFPVSGATESSLKNKCFTAWWAAVSQALAGSRSRMPLSQKLCCSKSNRSYTIENMRMQHLFLMCPLFLSAPRVKHTFHLTKSFTFLFYTDCGSQW